MIRGHTPRVLAALTLLAALTGCSTQQRHAALTFFFEGVPPLEGESPRLPASATLVATSAPPAAVTGSASTIDAIPGVEATAVPVTPAWPPHKPYVERKCNTCHASTFSEALKGPIKGICLACHEKVLNAGMVQHWPAKKGMCDSCHQSHQSVNDHLLNRPVPTLCLDCHDSRDTQRYVHFPVRRGRCFSCHTAHESKPAGLLRAGGDALCLRCHDQAEMVALPAHATAGSKACMVCHDPHQSEKKGLLK